MRERATLRGPTGSVFIDSRHLPVILVRWFVDWELELVAPLASHIEAALTTLVAEQTLGVLITDVSMIGPPPSAVRRALSQRRTEARELFDRCIVMDIIVTDKPVMRGALAALQWIAPWVRLTSEPNLDAALELGRRKLAAQGIDMGDVRAEDFG